jgi:hypothetical protein
MHWNLVHSFVDFNLQVNSNAALFYVFCALGAAPQTVETRITTPSKKTLRYKIHCSYRASLSVPDRFGCSFPGEATVRLVRPFG